MSTKKKTETQNFLETENAATDISGADYIVETKPLLRHLRTCAILIDAKPGILPVLKHILFDFNNPLLNLTSYNLSQRIIASMTYKGFGRSPREFLLPARMLKVLQKAIAPSVGIWIMDYAALRGLNVADAIIAKHKYNETRPHMHGGKKF